MRQVKFLYHIDGQETGHTAVGVLDLKLELLSKSKISNIKSNVFEAK